MIMVPGSFRQVCRVVCMVLLATCSRDLCGQTQNPASLIPTVIPPSPDAMAMGKYGSTPVGLSSGIPNISIPLYTIRQGSLEVPISASYMASGVKVSDIPSWIGLGWTLNANGVVTRSVVGQPDDLGFWQFQSRNTSQISGAVVDWVYGMANGGGDNESDFYFYNFNGHSGRFVFPQNDPDNPFLITNEAIRIVRLSGGFTIYDEVGTEYRFWRIENASQGGPTYASSYYLSSIISADGKDQIDFNYVTDDGIQPWSATYTETIGNTCPGNGSQHLTNSSGGGPTIVNIKLSTITWANGRVNFILDNSRSDGPGSRLDQIQVQQKNTDGTYTTKKYFTFGEGYFGSSGNYRLKLTNIVENDAATAAVSAHTFSYDESITMPVRNSPAQDWWGFYNGKTSNTSLIAQRTISLSGTAYTVGAGNNRDPSATHMQALVLKKITYPTGGYTEFDYEPHQYAGGTNVTSASIFASAGIIGNTVDLQEDTKAFTPVSSGWAKISTFCSNVTNAIPYFSRVQVTQQSTGQSLLDYQYTPTVDPLFPATRAQDFMIYVTGGVTYNLKVMSKGSSTATQFSGAAFSQATAFWDNVTSTTSSIAGGLRVKEVRDYPSSNDVPVTRVYKYGASEGGLGILLIPSSAFANRTQTLTVKYYSGNPCLESCSWPRQIISGSTRYDLTSPNGAVVVYPEVAVYEKDVTGANGKRVSRFDVVPDTYGPGEMAYGEIGYQIDNSWKGGNEIYNSIVRSDGTTPVKETFTATGIYGPQQIYGTKIGWRIVMEGCTNSFATDPGEIERNFYWFDYPYYSGIKKPVSVRDVTYSQSSPIQSATTLMNYYYDNLTSNHQQLSRRVTIDSDGSTRQMNYWYPADYNNVEQHPAMVSKHIIGLPVKEEVHVNGMIVSGKISKFNADGKPVEIYQYESASPQTPSPHNPNSLLLPGYLKKADLGYDATTKKLTQTQLVNNTKTSYIWGYNNAFPTAMIVNASSSEAAATSFESDAKGNWTYSGPTYSDIVAKSGQFYYKLGGGSITRSLATGTYKLEYWAKGTVNLSGGTITAIRTSAADANGWILYEKEVKMTATTTLTISGSATAFIDELRVYPASAQMTTYTYDRINGITSATDPKNATTYYEYDNAGRLKWIKDNLNNVVRTYDYHYKGY